MRKNRRWVLRGGALAGLVGVAGCSSVTDSLDSASGSGGDNSDDGPSSGGSDRSPTEVVRVYFRRLDDGDVDGVNQLFHSEGDAPRFTEEAAEETSEVSITVDTVSEVERSGGSAIVRAVITGSNTDGDQEDQIAQGFELRVEDGQWRIFSSAEVEPVEGSGGNTGGGTLALEFSRDVDDRNWEYWNVVNDTGELAELVTIDRVDREGNRTYAMFYRLPTGEKRSFAVRNDTDEPTLTRQGTWLESQYRPTEEDLDATAMATGIDEFSNIVYSLPNPTGITGEDIREVTTMPTGDDVVSKAGTPSVGVNGGELTLETSGPIWTDTYTAEVSGVSDSETFTFSASPQPEVDISVDDLSIDDFVRTPTVTFTAESETPVVNATVLVMAGGPSFLNPEFTEYRAAARSDTEAATLVTTDVGDARVGASRTVTFDEYRSTDVDYPLEENDVIRVGVISAAERGQERYPIAYTERPLLEFTG